MIVSELYLAWSLVLISDLIKGSCARKLLLVPAMTNSLMLSPHKPSPSLPSVLGLSLGSLDPAPLTLVWSWDSCDIAAVFLESLCIKSSPRKYSIVSFLSTFLSSSKCLLSCVCIITSKMHQPHSARCTPAQTTCLSSWSVPLRVSTAVP